MTDVWASLQTDIWRAAGLFIYALFFAVAEIEIEGERGWAEDLPTWYRVSPWYARLFRNAMAGKPLTGYHAVMLPLTFLSFHTGLAFGLTWSFSTELVILARFLFWVTVWDFLWFLWNPFFGWQRFQRREVWWLGRRWIGPFPGEYWMSLLLSFAFVLVPSIATGDLGLLRSHAIVCVAMIVFTAMAAVATPLYKRWYQHMRRPGTDERARAIPERP